MVNLFTSLLSSPLAFSIVVPIASTTIYVAYYRLFHTLSSFPGPFLASLTNVWKAYHLWTLHLPEKLLELHEKYGEVVRVGPNDLSIRTKSSSGLIYKSGRLMPKTKFYDGFTAFNPNLFGTQDEEVSGWAWSRMRILTNRHPNSFMQSAVDKWHTRFLFSQSRRWSL